jgi:hypothetical protein
MIKVTGVVIDKSFGSDPFLPNIPVYVSDEKGKSLQPVKSTVSGIDGKYIINVDDSVKFISARVNSENILTKPIASVLNFDFSNVSAKVLDEVVITAKRPVKVKVEKEIKKDNVFLKYLPQGLFILTGLIVVSTIIYFNKKK